MFYPYGLRLDTTILILIPAMFFTIYAQGKVKSSFAKYLRVPSIKGYSGYEVARKLLDDHGLNYIPIELSKGQLTDHYDPTNKVLRLSREVYSGNSIASVSVAAHEVGHAVQHASSYPLLVMRNKIYPLSSIGSSAAWFFIFIGLLIPSMGSFMDIGIILFSMAVLFQIITLPVEINASSRAMGLLSSGGFIMENEERGSKKVLDAAALTYIAAMATGISQLIRLIMIRNRRNS